MTSGVCLAKYNTFSNVKVQILYLQEIFSSFTLSDWSWGLCSLLYNGYWGSFPGVKQLMRDIDHTPPSSAMVKKE
jgi:hypothetical protein